MTDIYANSDRRTPAIEVFDLIKEIRQHQQEIDNRLTKHMNDETKELAEVISEIMKAAFPDGDPEGHRRRHELELEELKERTEFWKKMRLELAKWGLLGFLGWASLALWSSFILGPAR